MSEKIRIIQYGCGKMGRLIMGYALRKGCEIAAAFDSDSRLWGEDIGSLIGIRDLGIKVDPEYRAEKMLAAVKGDIMVIATESRLKDVAPIYRLAINNGLNAISSAEEALYPWNSSPALAASLDAEAKICHCTISAGGYTDFAWGTLVKSFAGAAVDINILRGESVYNAEDYGAALCLGHGIGLSPSDFAAKFGVFNDCSYPEIQKLILSDSFEPSYMWNQNGWLASSLGLRIIDQRQRLLPVIAERQVYSNSLVRNIPAGHVIGLTAEVISETAEGVRLESINRGQIFTGNMEDYSYWRIKGDPDFSIKVDLPPTPNLTASALVSRIPQVIKSYPGYITSDRLDDLNFTPVPYIRS